MRCRWEIRNDIPTSHVGCDSVKSTLHGTLSRFKLNTARGHIGNRLLLNTNRHFSNTFDVICVLSSLKVLI